MSALQPALCASMLSVSACAYAGNIPLTSPDGKQLKKELSAELVDCCICG